MKRLLKLSLWLVLPLAVVYGIIWFTPFRSNLPGYGTYVYIPEDYRKECDSIFAQKKRLSGTKKTDLLRDAVAVRLFNYWEGTRWGFNGTTTVPGKGKIACGYFVTTVLRDCGFNIDRVKLARMASEDMIKELVKEKNIRRYSRFTLQKFIADVKKDGNQLYIVGLDSHVGFLVCDKDGCWFIHSSGRFPWRVVKEKAENSIVLAKSGYRVTGCLTKDEKFMGRW